MNQCARAFVLTGLVVAILLAMHLMPTLYLGDVELRHVNILSDVVPEPYGTEGDADEIPTPEPPKPVAAADSDSVSVAFKEIQPKGVTMIDDYSGGASGGMSHFYGMLAKVKSAGRPVRIAYFGDSFIEGDILTCDLRDELQKKFGGNGVGWVDCGSKINGFRRTITQKFAGFEEYEVVKKPFSHKYEGINQRYFVPSEGAFVTTRGTRYKARSSDWSVASLFLRADTTLTVTAKTGGGRSQTFGVNASPYVQMLSVTDTMNSISYSFGNVGKGTYVYGMALESHEGIVLDNFSMRGSAGYTLANIPQQTLRDFARLRPYDLIILHYGLNVLNEKSRTENYKAYVKRMHKAVENLRKAYPEASILIMSVPDRDQRTADGIRTMNGVEALAAYQQILASECNVAYLNLFKAMGGRESMKAMVEKGWANKDYTHLSFAGGKHVAGLILDSFMAGYENFKLRNNIE